MAKCYRCENETELHEAGVPICPACKITACEERDALMSRLESDLKTYANAVRKLQQSGGDATDVYESSERARLAYEAARRQYTDHIDAHGCDAPTKRTGQTAAHGERTAG